MSENTRLLAAAALSAARSIEEVAEELGVVYMAAQLSYGLEVEALVDGEWVDVGDLNDGAEIEAVRLHDCDGERGRVCRTVEQIEAEQGRWIEALQLSVCE